MLCDGRREEGDKERREEERERERERRAGGGGRGRRNVKLVGEDGRRGEEGAEFLVDIPALNEMPRLHSILQLPHSPHRCRHGDHDESDCS